MRATRHPTAAVGREFGCDHCQHRHDQRCRRYRRSAEVSPTHGRSGGTGTQWNHPYECAFRDATAISVGIALGVSALAALALSWYLSCRVHRSATALSEAASAVSKGHYDIRVPPPGLGKEFDAVAEAFNRMARQLGDIDNARRQMLADLAHEIRTPVAVLDAYMEALEDGVQRLDHDTIGTLRDQTRRLARFSVDVNALSAAERRTTSIDARWISPKALISTAVAAFAPRFCAEGVDLTSRIADDLPALWGDPERLGQVLSNLLDNALRHSGRGGSVSVTASVADDELTIAVSDTGTGVAPEHLPRLFDRFYRADAAARSPARRSRHRAVDRQSTRRGPRRPDRSAQCGTRNGQHLQLHPALLASASRPPGRPLRRAGTGL